MLIVYPENTELTLIFISSSRGFVTSSGFPISETMVRTEEMMVSVAEVLPTQA